MECKSSSSTNACSFCNDDDDDDDDFSRSFSSSDWTTFDADIVWSRVGPEVFASVEIEAVSVVGGCGRHGGDGITNGDWGIAIFDDNAQEPSPEDDRNSQARRVKATNAGNVDIMMVMAPRLVS